MTKETTADLILEELAQHDWTNYSQKVEWANEHIKREIELDTYTIKVNLELVFGHEATERENNIIGGAYFEYCESATIDEIWNEEEKIKLSKLEIREIEKYIKEHYTTDTI